MRNADDVTERTIVGGAPTRAILVEDEPAIAELERRWLEADGHTCDVASTAKEAWALLGRHKYDLMLCDVKLEESSGVDLLRQVRERFGNSLAVLMATGVSDREIAVECLRIGAYGYLVKPLNRHEVMIHVAGALERRRLVQEAERFQEILEDKVRRRTAEVREREEDIVWRLLWAADRHDEETSSHVRRIGLSARALAEAIGWSPARLDDLKLAAAMHDIGKLGVPDAILRKPGALSPEEWAIMQQHTLIGAEILGSSSIPLLQLAEEIALNHHERWDGKGYPNGLAGTDIPEAARIVAIVDVYDALSHDRTYRPKFPDDVVAKMMLEERGKHFDPMMFDAFFEILPRVKQLRQLIRSSERWPDQEVA